MASTVGIPAASLCINRRLYSIANVKSVSIGPAEVSNVVNWTWLSCKLTLLLRNTVPFWWIHSFVFFFQLSMLLYVCSFYRLSWTPHNELLTSRIYCPRPSFQYFRRRRMLSCVVQHSPHLFYLEYVAHRYWLDFCRLLWWVLIASVLTDAI